jgi:hypothetical protein
VNTLRKVALGRALAPRASLCPAAGPEEQRAVPLIRRCYFRCYFAVFQRGFDKTWNVINLLVGKLPKKLRITARNRGRVQSLARDAVDQGSG